MAAAPILDSDLASSEGGVASSSTTELGGDPPPTKAMRSPRFSNPDVRLPLGTLCELPNVLSDEEAAGLVKAIDNEYHRKWSPEGYDRRHRVQRFSSFDVDAANNSSEDGFEGREGGSAEEEGGASMEEAFGWIVDRIASRSKLPHRPFEVVVVEHTPSSCRSVVNVFEQNSLCPCVGDEHSSGCNCYIAQLTLVSDAVQSIEKPMHRELECWDLATPVERHQTKIVMERGGVVVKTGECLWNWRGRISAIRERSAVSADGAMCEGMSTLDVQEKKVKKPWTKTDKLKASNKRCITVTFRGILAPNDTTTSEEATLRIPKEVKSTCPLSELLSVIVTTSPIRSHPSTELLERTFDTFPFAGDEFAYECPKVIVCDGCRIMDEENDPEEKKSESHPPKITRKYSNVKQTLRNGIATTDQANNYTEFKARLRKLCEEANEPTQTKNPFRNTEVVELDERHGYGFALRHALYHCVTTPYVCVIQHDRTFMRPTPIKQVVSAMEHDPEERIKYVGMNMRSNLMYHDIFSGKYGRKAVDEFKTMILRPDELCIGGNVYGAEGTSVKDMIPPKTDKRRKILEALRETYRGSHQYITYEEQSRGVEAKEGFHQLTLSPTLFWYDNTHVVRTDHYRDFVFHPQYKMVARGGFVEDKLSPCMIRSCERLGLNEGHSKFGCYLLDDHSGVVFTGHLDGGSYMTADLHRDPKGDRYAAKVRDGSNSSG